MPQPRAKKTRPRAPSGIVRLPSRVTAPAVTGTSSSNATLLDPDRLGLPDLPRVRPPVPARWLAGRGPVGPRQGDAGAAAPPLEVRDQGLERLDHVAVALVPRRDVPEEHRPVIRLGVLHQARVLHGIEILVAGHGTALQLEEGAD